MEVIQILQRAIFEGKRGINTNTHFRGKDNVFPVLFLQSSDELIQPGSQSEK